MDPFALLQREDANVRSREPVSGVLNVNKPAGITSHDVVNRLRRLAGQRRVGHAGTLDPIASGVLVLCLGQATRLAEYLSRHDKSYRAVLRLGQTTDTYDAQGRLIAESQEPLPTREQVEQALERFRGHILQVPPAHSAIKERGRPLYQRARRGELVRPSPRLVTIHRLELVEWNLPFMTLEIECSAGTYVRSLAHDLGMALGCGAHVAGLVRTRSGHFRIEEAHSLEELEGEAEGQRWRRHVLPMDVALADFDALEVDQAEAQRIAHGQPIEGPVPRRVHWARAYSEQGEFLAVMEFVEASQLWHPRKVFVA